MDAAQLGRGGSHGWKAASLPRWYPSRGPLRASLLHVSGSRKLARQPP